MNQISGQQDFQLLFYCSDQDPCPDPIEEKIQLFTKLQEGWNYGEGRVPSQSVIDRAIKIYRSGKQLGLDAEVFPLINGGIEISLYREDHFMDILVHEGGRLDFSYEVGIGERYNRVDYIENISIETIKQRLSELSKLCGASESSETTTIQLNGDLFPVASSTAMGGFQLLIKNALWCVIIPQFVNTSIFSTVPSS